MQIVQEVLELLRANERTDVAKLTNISLQIFLANESKMCQWKPNWGSESSSSSTSSPSTSSPSTSSSSSASPSSSSAYYYYYYYHHHHHHHHHPLVLRSLASFRIIFQASLSLAIFLQPLNTHFLQIMFNIVQPYISWLSTPPFFLLRYS